MPDASTSALVTGLFRRQRRDTTLGALCWSTHQVCEALVPVAIGLVVQYAVTGSDGSAMVLAVLGVLGLFLVLTMAWRTGMWFLSRAVVAEAHRLRMDVVRRVIADRPTDRPTDATASVAATPGAAPAVSERRTGELLSIAGSDTQAAAELLEVVSRGAAALVGLVVTAVVLLRIDWSLGVGVLIGIPLLVLGLNVLGPRVERRTAGQQQAAGLAAASAADLLAGLRPLRGFGGVPEAVRRYRGASRTSLIATVGAARAEAAFVGVSTFATGAVLAVVAAVSGGYALAGRIDIGELITVIGLAAFLSDPVQNLAQCLVILARSRASAHRVVEVLARPVSAEAELERLPVGPLVLDRVVAPGLDGLDLRVEPGEVVGVVTTAITTADTVGALLDGRAVPESGTVRLAGQDWTALPAATRHHAVLVEPHVTELFGSTLREVLDTGSDPTRSDDAQLTAALTDAAAADLSEAAGGLDRELFDHGQNLSGGQRQRVALARALLADRPVLVLRDPSTAVDAVTEHAMAEGLRARRAGADRLTVVLSTSAPLLDRCDRVVFVSDGRVVGDGPHRTLLADPAYAAVVLR